jgi:hypothetical protein
MATSTGQRFLEGSGDDLNRAIIPFYNVVQEAFHAKTLLWNAVASDGGVGSEGFPSSVVVSRTVSFGGSHQFITLGQDGTPEDHTPGVELLGQSVDLEHGNITIDAILVSHRDFAGDHDALSHFDIMAPHARKIARELATEFDKRLFRLAVLAANTAATSGIHNGGNIVSNAGHATVAAAYPTTSTGATHLQNDIAELAKLQDEDDAPEDGRFLAISPYARQVLTNGDLTRWFDTQLSNPQNNSLNQRIIGQLHGFNVLTPTNHLPSTDVTTGPTKYRGDFTVASAAIGQPVAVALSGADEGTAAIGYVTTSHEKFGAIYTFAMFDERRNTWFMKAQMMVGADILAPWCAGAIIVED